MKEASRLLGKMLGIVDKILYAVCCSLNHAPHDASFTCSALFKQSCSLQAHDKD